MDKQKEVICSQSSLSTGAKLGIMKPARKGLHVLPNSLSPVSQHFPRLQPLYLFCTTRLSAVCLFVYYSRPLCLPSGHPLVCLEPL